MAQATASTRAFGDGALKSAHQHREAFTTLGLAGIAVAGGIGLAMKAAADAAIEFESSFAGVRKTVDASEAEFAVLEQDFRDMAKTIPVNVNELNRIGEAAGQLGIRKEGIVQFTETVAKLGVTTNIVGDEAATAMARIANVMQTPQDEFDRMGATIVALGNAGASTEAEIVEMAMRIAGAGQIVGLTEAEVLAFANALSSVGVEAQMGGTAISRVFVDMANDVASGGDRLETFAQVAGMSADEFAQAFEQDAAGAMITFIEGLGRVEASGGNVFAVLEQLGLTEVRVRDALLRAAGAGDLFRESLELGSRAWEENNALNEEAAKRFGTTASQIQLAKNRLNEVAIGFGQLLLPTIAAVVGAIGDIAELIGGLPGPVKAAALVFGALAAGLALVSGATFLLLPRLAAVKIAMAQMGIQGGLLRGSLAFAAKAINPWTIGLTAATVVLTMFASKSAETRATVQEFTAAIEADTGALGANTRAAIVNRLETEGLLEAYAAGGVNGAELADGIMAVVDAHQAGDEAAVAHALAELNAADVSEVHRLKLGGLIGALNLAADAEDRMADAGKDNAGAQDEAAGAAGVNADATGDLGIELEEAATMADQLTEALELLAGVQITAEEAQLDYLDGLVNLRKELKDGAKTLDINTEAGRANRSALLDQIDKAMKHAAAVADQTGSVERGSRVMRDHIEEIIEMARRSGINEDAVRDYIRQLNLTPAEIKTALRLLGVESAVAGLFRVKSVLAGIPDVKDVLVRFQSTGGGTAQQIGHAGGVVGALGARRMHGGGRLRGDEEWIIGQRGERLVSARDWRTLQSITGSGAAAAPRAPAPDRGGRDVSVAVRLDRRRFTDEFDHDATYAGRWAS